MRLALAASIAAWAVACDGGPAAGDPCESNAECGNELVCVEGACTHTFDRPPGDPEPGAGPARVFSVGWKVDLDELETFESFDSAVRERIASEVTPHLATDRPNLIVFPENMGLLAALVGERGAAARAASQTSDAFVALNDAYAGAIDHYRGRTDELLPLGRAILLGVTDTLWRTLQDTFAALADELGAYIAVTYDVADATRTTDPSLVDLLVDDSVTSPEGAWLAEGDEVFNQTVLYGPDGQRIDSWRKEYLVPTEASLLTLTPGSPGRLPAASLPFGPTASVISKDAWMPDVLDRMASRGARLMLQPEAFDRWAVPHGEDGAWAPDVVKESGWAHVIRYPEFRANVLSCLSGNLFEEVFDCQSAIFVDPHVDGTGAFIGQDPDVGFARVAPWVVEDDFAGTLEERRARLAEEGEKLLPGSGEPEENGYVASTVWMDVDLDAPWPDAAATESLRGDVEGQARRPALAALDDGTVVALWEDTRDGPSRPFAARSSEGGASFGPSRMAAPVTEGFRAPALASDGEALHAVWRKQSADGGDVWYARSDDGGRSFPDPIALAGSPEDGAAQHAPAVAVDRSSGTVHAVWIDDGSGAMRVHYARSTNGGARFGDPRPLEAAPRTPLESSDNRWEPVVAARGGAVAVAWASFRTDAWTIEGTVSPDDGAAFGMPTRWDDADVPFETIHSDPDLVPVDGGAWLLAWTDLRVRRPDYDVRARRIPADGEVSDAPPSLLLSGDDPDGRPQWAPSLAAPGDTIVAVWQDFRANRNETWMAQSADGGLSFGPGMRVSPEGGPERFRPQVAPLPDER
ncbi:MAG: hypothetical protein ACODAU_13560, partial [Myxococcota bacterium]